MKTIMKFSLIAGVVVFLLIAVVAPVVNASPYGTGYYDANVPYDSQTSLTINTTSGSVSIPITPSGGGTLGEASGSIVVTSTDVTGYKLYIQALSTTNMTSGANTIPTSANSSPAALANDTWGYNLDGSTNFVGVSLTNTLIKSFTGPTISGDTTSITYGVKVDDAKGAGQYQETIVYTAVPQTT